MLTSSTHPPQLVSDWPHIPKQAFLYFPSPTQIHSGSGKSYTRRIFEGSLPYSQFQQKKLLQLDQAFNKLHKTLMPWFTRANKLRFIQASKFDIDKSVKSILENNEWRLKTFPIPKNSFMDSFIESGAIYICGRDHCYRPIIVIDLSRFDTNNSEIQKPEFLSKVLAIYFEFMINHMFIEGQVENYVMIINLNSMMMFTIGGIAKRLLEFTNNMYRSRLFMAYIVNTSSGISFFWKPVQSFLSENTLKKIILTDKPWSDQLFQHTNPIQIEEKYGGKQPNIKGGFYPPSLYSENFLLPGERVESKLVREEQYLGYYREGKLEGRKVAKGLVGRADEDGGTSVKQSEIRPFSPFLMKKDSMGSMRYESKFRMKTEEVREEQIRYQRKDGDRMSNQVRNSYESLRNQQKVNTPTTTNFQLTPISAQLPPIQQPQPQPQLPSQPQHHHQQQQLQQRPSLKRKDSLQQQMRMDLEFIGANALGGTNSIVNMPVGEYPVHRTLAVETFFQQGEYIGMKRRFNPGFRA